jgi:hypothetical protein
MASYGTEAGVAALARRHTTSGVFDATTNPTYVTVTGWLAQVSAMVNIALSTNGFTTPITDADITPALDGFVNSLVADLAAGANSAGRFYSERMLETGVSPMKVIKNDIAAWVADNVQGFIALGVARVNSPEMGSILFRDTDESGSEISPIFQRKGFGNTFQDWDGDSE